MLAATTNADRDDLAAPRSGRGRGSPANAATAGSRLMSTLEDVARDAAQRLGLERVRHGGAEEADCEADGEDAGRQQVVPPSAIPGPSGTSAATTMASATPSAPRKRGPARGGEDDVDRPAAPATTAKAQAERVEAVRAAGVGEQDDAGGGEHDPDQVERAAGPDDRHGQRPGELDRHRDAERDAVQRLVEVRFITPSTRPNSAARRRSRGRVLPRAAAARDAP